MRDFVRGFQIEYFSSAQIDGGQIRADMKWVNPMERRWQLMFWGECRWNETKYQSRSENDRYAREG